MKSSFQLLLFVCLLSASTNLWAADKKEGGSRPTYLLSGDAQLLSHFIDRGLSITDGNPGLNASFLFNFGEQLRVGFWGSNISNLSYADDNLWLKLIAEVHIDFSNDSLFKFYFNDDRYYQSHERNGQAFGFKYKFRDYFSQIEWLSNFQGTRTSAFYLNLGRHFPLYKEIKGGAAVGYTSQKSDIYPSYIDAKGFATYKVTEFFEIESGVTGTSHGSQYNGRGDIAIYLGIKMIY